MLSTVYAFTLADVAMSTAVELILLLLLLLLLLFSVLW
jgi:hypothetical protein